MYKTKTFHSLPGMFLKYNIWKEIKSKKGQKIPKKGGAIETICRDMNIEIIKEAKL